MDRAAPKQRVRRAVVNDMRRKIERALGVADAAEELGIAVEAVLTAAKAERRRYIFSRRRRTFV